MASSAQGIVRAEQVLQLRSEREAIDLTQEMPSATEIPSITASTVSRNQNKVARAWQRHVVLSVPHQMCRDHFGEYQQPFCQIACAN